MVWPPAGISMNLMYSIMGSGLYPVGINRIYWDKLSDGTWHDLISIGKDHAVHDIDARLPGSISKSGLLLNEDCSSLNRAY